MSKRRFVLVILNSKNHIEASKVTKILDRAPDWIEFVPNNWLVWTSLSATRWYSRLKPLLASGDNLFICEVNIQDRSGFMPKSFWDFLRSKTAEEK